MGFKPFSVNVEGQQLQSFFRSNKNPPGIHQVTGILPPFVLQKTSNVGMRGVYPEVIDWNIVLRTPISFWP